MSELLNSKVDIQLFILIFALIQGFFHYFRSPNLILTIITVSVGIYSIPPKSKNKIFRFWLIVVSFENVIHVILYMYFTSHQNSFLYTLISNYNFVTEGL
jgi:hypothetical protein